MLENTAGVGALISVLSGWQPAPLHFYSCADGRPVALSDRVSTTGTMIDGTEFDSSYKRGKPAVFAPRQVIKGWTEAMQLMRPGDKWELYIPSELAYGSQDKGACVRAGGRACGACAVLVVHRLDRARTREPPCTAVCWLWSPPTARVGCARIMRTAYNSQRV